jgi:hypothetical protein
LVRCVTAALACESIRVLAVHLTHLMFPDGSSSDAWVEVEVTCRILKGRCPPLRTDRIHGASLRAAAAKDGPSRMHLLAAPVQVAERKAAGGTPEVAVRDLSRPRW